MFKFIVKKGLRNLVLEAYELHFHIYKEEIMKILPKLTENTTEKEMLEFNFGATQKYYTTVFNYVCQEVGKKNSNFKTLLPLKIATYKFDPDSLAAWTIYDFIFWCLTDKKTSKEECQDIYNLVNERRNNYLLTLHK